MAGRFLIRAGGHEFRKQDELESITLIVYRDCRGGNAAAIVALPIVQILNNRNVKNSLC
jgi:hypothetical protein